MGIVDIFSPFRCHSEYLTHNFTRVFSSLLQSKFPVGFLFEPCIETLQARGNIQRENIGIFSYY